MVVEFLAWLGSPGLCYSLVSLRFACNSQERTSYHNAGSPCRVDGAWRRQGASSNETSCYPDTRRAISWHFERDPIPYALETLHQNRDRYAASCKARWRSIPPVALCSAAAIPNALAPTIAIAIATAITTNCLTVGMITSVRRTIALPPCKPDSIALIERIDEIGTAPKVEHRDDAGHI
jgi:hypothetical protein